MWATSTPELDSIVKNGYEINFVSLPPLTQPCNKTILPHEELDIVRGEVKNLLAKGAIEVVENPGFGYYSRMFVRPKPSTNMAYPSSERQSWTIVAPPYTTHWKMFLSNPAISHKFPPR